MRKEQEIESGLLDRNDGGVGDERRLHLVRCGSFGGVDRFHGAHADDGRWAHGRRGLLFSQKHERARCRAVGVPVVGRSGEDVPKVRTRLTLFRTSPG